MQTITLGGSAIDGVGPRAFGIAELPLTVRLGRVRGPSQPKAVRLSDHFDTARIVFGALPDSTSYRTNAATALARMYCNNVKGCCVISGKLHSIGVWTGNDGGRPVEASDDECDQQYESICGHLGFDSGCIITEVLDYWAAHGLRVGGLLHKIDGYCAVDWTNKTQVKTAQTAFAANTVGISLPQDWTQNAVWDVTNSPIVGGHDVTVIDYDARGVYVSSWGRIYLITWAAFMSRQWIEEYWAVLSPDWYGSDNIAPCGIDRVSLAKALEVFRGGGTPNLDPAPPVPVPVPPLPTPPGPVDPTLPALEHDGGLKVPGLVASWHWSAKAGSHTGIITGSFTR